MSKLLNGAAFSFLMVFLKSRLKLFNDDFTVLILIYVTSLCHVTKTVYRRKVESVLNALSISNDYWKTSCRTDKFPTETTNNLQFMVLTGIEYQSIVKPQVSTSVLWKTLDRCIPIHELNQWNDTQTMNWWAGKKHKEMLLRVKGKKQE